MKKLTEQQLKNKYEILTEEIEELYDILERIPIASPLGRLSIFSTIHKKEKKKEKIKEELEKRI